MVALGEATEQANHRLRLSLTGATGTLAASMHHFRILS